MIHIAIRSGIQKLLLALFINYHFSLTQYLHITSTKTVDLSCQQSHYEKKFVMEKQTIFLALTTICDETLLIITQNLKQFFKEHTILKGISQTSLSLSLNIASP